MSAKKASIAAAACGLLLGLAVFAARAAPPVVDIAGTDPRLKLKVVPQMSGGGLDSYAHQYNAGGAGAGGMAVAMLTHFALMKGTEANQRSKLAELMDRIAGPYNEEPAALTRAGLLAGVQDPGRWATEAPPDVAWERAVATPEYLITEDESTLTLVNAISMERNGSPPRQVTVAAVGSLPGRLSEKEGDERTRHLGDVHAVARDLFVLTMDVAWKAPAQPATESGPERSFTYQHGGNLKLERGRELWRDARYVVIRTRTGSLLALPVR